MSLPSSAADAEFSYASYSSSGSSVISSSSSSSAVFSSCSRSSSSDSVSKWIDPSTQKKWDSDVWKLGLFLRSANLLLAKSTRWRVAFVKREALPMKSSMLAQLVCVITLKVVTRICSKSKLGWLGRRRRTKRAERRRRLRIMRWFRFVWQCWLCFRLLCSVIVWFMSRSLCASLCSAWS